MDASIKGASDIKTFVRLLQCASKFGDDLHICIGEGLWEMSAVDSSKSAFCLFKLSKDFFYKWEKRVSGQIMCRILVKSVIAVLGKSAQMSTVQRIDLRIIDPSDELKSRLRKRRRGGREADGEEQKVFVDDGPAYPDDDEAVGGIEAKLIMRLVCDHGVIRKHSLHLGTSEFNRADVDPETTPSGFTISSRTLRDWLDHFSISMPTSGSNASGGLSQLGWMFAKDHVKIKSWEGPGNGNAGLSTEITVDTEEFEDYGLIETRYTDDGGTQQRENPGPRVDLTLPMKEFKATLVLAEQLSINLNMAFSEAGQPFTITNLENELEYIQLFCAIATRECYAFADTTLPDQESSARTRTAQIPKSRTTTAQQPEASNATTLSSKQRREERSQRKGPSRLTLTAQPTDVEKLVTVYLPEIGHTQKQLSQRTSDHIHPREEGAASASPSSRRSDDQEPLFLPQSQDAASPETLPPQSQSHATQSRVKMTQREVLEYAGLGDVNMDELGEELDFEEEEEARTSSQLDDRVKASGNSTHQETEDETARRQDVYAHRSANATGAEENDFTWDTTIDMGPLDGQARAQFDGGHVGAKAEHMEIEIMQKDEDLSMEEWDEEDTDGLEMTQIPEKSKYRPLFDD
ncbi:cell cycle checkpoint control protein RAD9A [Cryptococcus neoformans Ze90-1]|nr:cell cycle checkpoint control protein RAD9A [Cryptococcus neoformans var. grubii Ze90-1]